MDHNYTLPVAHQHQHSQGHPQQVQQQQQQQPLQQHQHQYQQQQQQASHVERGVKRPYPSSNTSSNSPTATSTAGGTGAAVTTFSRAAVSYPRKRAIAACQVCRGRKTKCDNERPSCGFCRQAGAICVYEGDKQATFDAASLAILDRLAKIETRLDYLSVPQIPPPGQQLQQPQTSMHVAGINSPSPITIPQQQQPLNHLPPIQYHPPPQPPQPFKPAHGIIPQQALPPTPPIQTSILSPPSAGHNTNSLAPPHPTVALDQHQLLGNHLSTPLQTPASGTRRPIRGIARLASVGTTVQDILRWPIFEGNYDSDSILAPVFEDDDEFDDDSDFDDFEGDGNNEDGDRKTRWGGSIKGPVTDVDEKELEQHDLRHLIERFLTNVQTKNPILDQAILEDYADEIEAHGFDGSGKSCIVLMVCALGAISAPYSECFPNSPKSSPIYPNLHIGKLFFTAAKKRFGTAIVRNKLTTVQCLFLAGIYCMYTMQQFSAWKMFNSASVACQAYLMKRKTWRGLPSSAGPVVNVGKGRRKKRRMADIEDRDGVISEETQNFEKRIYWSCLKSEVEICVELETCTSGLSELRYPHAFPSPPRHSRSPPAVEAPATNSTNSGTTGEGVYPLSSVLNATSSPTNNTSIQSPLSNSTNTPHTPATTVATSSSRTNYYTGSTTANPQEDEITWFYYLAEIALRKIERKISEALHPDPVTGPRARKNLPTSDDEDEDFNEDDPNNTTRSSPEYSRRRAHSNRHAVRNKYSLRPPPPPPPRCPAPAEMEELLNLTTEFEIQLGIWYSYLPSTVKFADLDPTPCRDERLQYLRGRSWKTKSDLYRPFLYHLIHQPHSNYIRNNYAPGTYERVAEFARKGLIYDKLFIMATVIEHRHHGAWLTLRNSGAGALVYLAAKKCGWFVKEGEANGGDGLVEIPEGCEEALEKTKKTLRFWGEKRGARDAIPLVEMICKVEEDWFGGGNGNGMKGEMGMGVMGVTTMGMEQGRW